MPRLISPSLAALSGAVLALALTGCKKPQIRVYTVAREQPAAPVTPPSSESPLTQASVNDTPRAQPHLGFKLPPGWKDEGGSQFSLQNFKISTANGTAMVNITPLAGMAGNDAAIVNLWRQQLGQPVLDVAAAVASLTPVEIGGEQGKLFELSGKRDGQTERIVTAFVHRPDGSWFYKLQGDDAVVTSQKPAFLDFLKTIKITPGDPTDAVAENKEKAPAEDAEPAVHMVAPQGWEAQPPGQMQVAKFAVEKDGGKADVSVSAFPSDTGGILANVNRWRRMLGLNEVDEAGLQECTSKLGDATIDGAPEAVLADLSNDNRRLLGAIVPREGRWWFYKMLGDAPVVNAEHDTFVQFVKSQP